MIVKHFAIHYYFLNSIAIVIAIILVKLNVKTLDFIFKAIFAITTVYPKFINSIFSSINGFRIIS